LLDIVFLLFFLPFYVQKKVLDFGARPGCFPQKSQARFDARIAAKTVDIYLFGQIFPAVIFNQIFQNLRKRDAVQRVIFLLKHGSKFQNLVKRGGKNKNNCPECFHFSEKKA
jgi:hypothetical protein